MKFNVVDISYIDSVQFVYPSFHNWTLNERIRDAQSGPLKDWQTRQNKKHISEDAEKAEGDGGGTELVQREGGDDVDGGGEQGDVAAAAAADEETPD